MKISNETYRRLLNNSITTKQNKYRNKKVEYKGIKFDSIKEKDYYLILKHYENNGKIKDLKRQVEFILQPSFKVDNKTIRAIKYIADFSYTDTATNEKVVVDVKSSITAKDKTYIIKKKLFMYKYKDYKFMEVL